VVGVLLLGVLSITAVQAVTRETLPEQPSQSMEDPEHSMNSAELALALLGVKEITPPRKLTGVGRETSTAPERRQVAYLLPFEIVSVHLLVVLIGAAYLARAKRRRGVVT
jgi:NADH-quinone oxidoreductase subunit J